MLRPSFTHINLLYKLHPNLILIAGGYEHTDVSYGLAVSDASQSAVHFGLAGARKLNEKTSLFTTLLTGSDTSLKEIGISCTFAKDTTFKMACAERKIKNVDLRVPVHSINSKEGYTMTGITCMFAFKL